MTGFFQELAPVAVVIGTTGWVRGRAAITDLTSLVESALDLSGEQVTAIVRRGR